MFISPRERLGLFVDGAHLHAACRALGFDIDFKRLLLMFRQQGHLVRALYYATVTEEDEFYSIRPLIDWLDYNGYTTITKLAKQVTDRDGRRKTGKIDVELTVDAMRLQSGLDHVVLFSGKADFKGLVAALQEQGKRVSIVSTLATQPAMVADELRRQADQFIDLAELEAQIGRPYTSRSEKSERS
jgi:uncharacterized LabA/DUF88 family protein